MSPILLRPIREQLEHDRVIRQLQIRWSRRFEAAINVANEEVVSVRSGDRTCYPDLVLVNKVGGRRLHGVVEVETAESVNHLEAMAEWSHFAKVRGAFYLYVPAGFTDVALRLCQATKINVTEIWAYYAIDAQAKFSLEYRSPRAKKEARAAKVAKEKTPGKKKSAKTSKAATSTSKRARATKVSKVRKAAKTSSAAKRAPLKRKAVKKSKSVKKATQSARVSKVSKKASGRASVRRTGKTGAKKK